MCILWGGIILNYYDSFYKNTIQNMIDGFACHKIIADATGVPIDCEFIDVNSVFAGFLGMDKNRIKGKKIKEIFPDIEKDDFNWISFFGKVALTQIPLSLEIYSKVFDKWFYIQAFSPEKGYAIGVFQDKTNDKIKEKELSEKVDNLSYLLEGALETESVLKKNLNDMIEIKDKLESSHEKMANMVHYDALTKLPNRTLFYDRLNHAMKTSKRNGQKTIVAYLDLDNFKYINDTYGHATGDAVIIEAANRITKCMREYDTVARLSGDEYSVLIQNVENVEDVIPIIERIKEAFYEPFFLEHRKIVISPSIGVAVFPEDGTTVEELLNNSDAAMYKAKNCGKNSYQFFNIKMKNEILKKINTERLLKKALPNKEFILYYQPQFEASSRKLRGFEALIRWNNPEMGFLSPKDFLSIAEKTGFIPEIGKWVLETACGFGKFVNDISDSKIIVAVNISPVQFKQKNFFDEILHIITSSGIRPSCLELDLPEDIFINDFDLAVKILSDLKKIGVRIALDGFGRGYSSLSYLKKLPIDLLKIDRSFIQEIDENNSEKDIMDLLISLMHKLNIETFAEGIESKEQLEKIVTAKCDNVQGFYLGRPLPQEEIIKLVYELS